jgi:hypothetical protein
LDRRSVRLCSRTSTGDRRRWLSRFRRCTSIARSPTPTWKPCLRTSRPTTPASRATAFIRLLRPRVNRRAGDLRPLIIREPSAMPPASPAAAAVPTSAGPLAFPTAEPTELAPDSIDLPTDPTESLTDCTTPLEEFLLRLEVFLPEALVPAALALDRDREGAAVDAERERVVDARRVVDRLARVALGARPFELPVDLFRLAVALFRADDFRLLFVVV